MNATRPAEAAATSADPASGQLPPGAMVADRYRIERALGEGGMGAVYLAEHVAMRKAVALKVLHAEGSKNAEIVQRFEREAVAAASIDHQNVAAATDFGALPDGSFFLVLEFVSGRSLREEVSAGALAPARALGIMRGIVAGLGAAHARGIVHRDLKPENVMLTEREGNRDFVKVLDFGIAKLDEPEERGPSSRPLTRIGTIMGTPNYMSPEQAVGQPCDARADFYALGVVFYEMLTGEALFDGDPVVVLAAHVTSPPPPLPAEVQDALGPHGEEVFQKLLAKAPADRYQTAAELQAALDQLGTQLSPPAPLSMPRVPSATASAPSVRISTTNAAAVAAVVSAPTQVAGLPVQAVTGIGPDATPLEEPRAPAPGVPTAHSQRMMLGGALAVGATGIVILLVFALRGPSPDAAAGNVPTTALSATITKSDDAELPPLPSGHVDGKSAPPGTTPASAASGKPAGKGGGKKGKGSGPGGILKPLGKLFD